MRIERREHVTYKIRLPDRNGVLRELTINDHGFDPDNGLTFEEIQAIQDAMNALADRQAAGKS